jgi:hypothetical protein
MRLKDEGTEEANFYNKLALTTIGERDWNAMKRGTLNWSYIDDRYFRIAELLSDQLETIPKSELLEKTSKK